MRYRHYRKCSFAELIFSFFALLVVYLYVLKQGNVYSGSHIAVNPITTVFSAMNTGWLFPYFFCF